MWIGSPSSPVLLGLAIQDFERVGDTRDLLQLHLSKTGSCTEKEPELLASIIDE
jgi:hypothetical protein